MAEETILPPDDMDALDRIHDLLADTPGEVSIATERGDHASLPDPVREILINVVGAMRRGQAITIAPRAQRLTTQEAADLLGVSRPTLVKLLEDGRIPYETPGRHRRIKLVDLLTYQALRRGERQRLLGEMTEETQELGLYDQSSEVYQAALAEARKKLA